LTVLTGETGAGKSILLDALGLALGTRAEAPMVRSGAAQATASATFDPPTGHAARRILAQHGLEAEGPIILRRILPVDGRSRAYVNDQPASLTLVRELAEELLEIEGQFDSHALLDPANHRMLLDAFAGAT